MLATMRPMSAQAVSRRYTIEMTFNGFVAAVAVWLQEPALFYILIFNGIVELVFGYHRAAINVLLLDVLHLKRLENWLETPCTCKSPPKLVQQIQSSMLILLSILSIYLFMVAPEFMWLPGSFIGAMWFLAGVVGICPVAIVYALILNKDNL